MNKIYFEIRSYDAKTNTPIRFGCYPSYHIAEKEIWNLPDGKYEIKKVYKVQSKTN
ncbi:hypothetical protein ACTS94_05095 [Empedobacter falsenii]